MNFTQRCRIFALGVTMWIAVVAMGMNHTPFSEELGALHAGVAGLVAALAFVPRTMLRWA